MKAPDQALFEGQSDEFQLLCARDTSVLWADARAEQLGVAPGQKLRELAVDGSHEKLERLFTPRAVQNNDAWELMLRIGGAVSTVAVRARTTDVGTVALTGSLVPVQYGAVLTQLGQNLSEMAALHRETDRQQRELLRRHEELVRLHQELQESHRGVVALHHEIGDKDASLRRADEVKSRLVANVSHEFRTPLNSILGLTKLLLSRADGDLSEEQEKQLNFIKQSAESLYALVNDLLDLSKSESQRVLLRTNSFSISNFFASLRGMMRPIAETNSAVQLVFDEPIGLPELESDEGKVAQIIRNLVSNALKFTEQGEVRIAARASGNDIISISVSDTGVGIPFEQQSRVFEEFFQVDHPLQRKYKGTGLGLALSRSLAERLGGKLELDSQPGKGSTFTLTIPLRHPEVREVAAMVDRSRQLEPGNQPVLVVEDDRQTLLLYEKYLRGSGFQVIPARSLDEARAALTRIRPAAVVLDIMLDGEASWSFLYDLKSNEATRDIPALVVTVTNREERARALGADEFFMKPMEREWLLNKLKSLSGQAEIRTLLVIDDDKVARYLVQKHLADSPYRVIEAAHGAEGIELAREHHPDVIFLDFVMPEMSAFDVLDELKRDPATRNIPVVIYTSKNLAEEERKRLNVEASAILSKQSLSREIAIARIREALENATRGRKGAALP